jgi:HEAT repeat protein
MINSTSSQPASGMRATGDSGQIRALIAQLSSPDGNIRTKARFALVHIGNPAVEPLTQTCHGADTRLRWEICKTLSLIGDPAAVPALLQALEDDRFEIRWLAAEGLITIGGKSPEYLKALLHELLKHPTSGLLREGAHHIFHDLVVYNDYVVFKPLVETLADFNWTIKLPAVIDEILDNLAD